MSAHLEHQLLEALRQPHSGGRRAHSAPAGHIAAPHGARLPVWALLLLVRAFMARPYLLLLAIVGAGLAGDLAMALPAFAGLVMLGSAGHHHGRRHRRHRHH